MTQPMKRKMKKVYWALEHKGREGIWIAAQSKQALKNIARDYYENSHECCEYIPVHITPIKHPRKEKD